MTVSRRAFLTSAGAIGVAAAPAFALGAPAFAKATAGEPAWQWQESQRYPDPRIEILDPSLRAVPHQLAQGRAAGHRHALGRGPGLVRRRPLPAVERHPEQPHHEVGRGDRRGRACSASRRTTPTATRAIGRAGCSPASTTPAASRAPSTTARSPCSPTASTASRSTRRTTSSADRTARSGSPIRRSASSATTRATSPSRSCRPTSTASTRKPAS